MDLKEIKTFKSCLYFSYNIFQIDSEYSNLFIGLNSKVLISQH